MAIQFGGSAVNAISFNGSDVFAVVFNGAIVFCKGIASNSEFVTVNDTKITENVIYDTEHTYTNPLETVTSLKNKLTPPNATLHIYDTNGSEVSDSSTVGTKFTVLCVVNGATVESKTFVQKGDLNSDGSVNSTDSQIIIDHNSGTTVITDTDILDAMDVNDDGVIDYKDRGAIINFINRLES